MNIDLAVQIRLLTTEGSSTSLFAYVTVKIMHATKSIFPASNSHLNRFVCCFVIKK